MAGYWQSFFFFFFFFAGVSMDQDKAGCGVRFIVSKFFD